MNITLSPELETMIREKVEAGEYHDASEVVSEALHIMADRERRKRAKAELEVALAEAGASLDRGEGVELTDELWDQLMAEGDARAARGEPIDPLITGEY
jgi:antitoxin ParD1/3/4